MNNSFRLWRMVMIVAIVGGLLSVTGLAMAQSSAAYDLGCWGTITSGGGQRQSGSFVLRDATGQTAVGQANSSQFRLHAGYVQNWATLQNAAALSAEGVMPAVIEEDGTVFLPIVQNFVRLVRPCSF
jgi:hypothetical protein